MTDEITKLRARVGILEGFVQVVRMNIGKRVKRGRYPSPMTKRMDLIRGFLVFVDQHYKEQEKKS